jgi:hypothetical protein
MLQIFARMAVVGESGIQTLARLVRIGIDALAKEKVSRTRYCQDRWLTFAKKGE